MGSLLDLAGILDDDEADELRETIRRTREADIRRLEEIRERFEQMDE